MNSITINISKPQTAETLVSFERMVDTHKQAIEMTTRWMRNVEKKYNLTQSWNVEDFSAYNSTLYSNSNDTVYASAIIRKY